MAYITKKEKINKFIEQYVIPSVKIKDLDYDKTVTAICQEEGSSLETVEECLKNFISGKRLKKISILTIPDEEIGEFLKELKKKEETIKEMDQTMKKIEESVKGGAKI